MIATMIATKQKQITAEASLLPPAPPAFSISRGRVISRG